MSCGVRPDWVIRVVTVIAIALLASACATLPEVRYLNSSLVAPANPTVTDAQGTLSTKKSKSLLARRWRNSHVDIAALAALEEAATAVERYPRQLHEMDRGAYLEMKHAEHLRQQTVH